jgi:hypothetical protein
MFFLLENVLKGQKLSTPKNAEKVAYAPTPVNIIMDSAHPLQQILDKKNI